MSFIGAWIDGLLLVAGAHMAAIGYIVPVIGAAVVTLSGELLFKAFGLAAVAGWLSAAFVAGTTLTSVAMLVPTWILHWSAQDGFLAWSGLVLVAAVLAWRPLRDAPPVPWHGAAIPLAFALLVAWFSRHQIAAGPTLMQTGVLPTWLDRLARSTRDHSMTPFTAIARIHRFPRQWLACCI